MNRLKIIGVAATLAVLLLGAQPAAAAPAQGAAPAQTATTNTPKAEGRGVAPAITLVGCKVTQWTCVTPPLNTFDSEVFHYSTTGIPNLAPVGQPSSFVIVRDIADGGKEVNRQYRYGGDEHNQWSTEYGPVYSTYHAELHCPYTCQGAVLGFADG